MIFTRKKLNKETHKFFVEITHDYANEKVGHIMFNDTNEWLFHQTQLFLSVDDLEKIVSHMKSLPDNNLI